MDSWQYRAAADHGLKPHERLRSLNRESGMVAHLTQGAWRLVSRAYLRIYHRLTICGAAHIPKGAPFVVVGNHSSHLDALTLAAALPWKLRRWVFPIAAGDVFFETPAVSIFSALMLNALPMWRKRCGPHALAELRERLIGEPAIYILFPEGTRSRDGKLGRFKPGIGMIVGGSPALVVPCHLSGAYRAFPPEGKLPRPYKLHLEIGAPLDFSQVTNDREGWLEVAQRTEAAVAELALKAAQR